MNTWRRIEADGAEWEVRVHTREDAVAAEGGGEEGDEEVLEFRATDGLRRPRRVAVASGAVAGMDESGLLAAFRRARPIGGDSYGRPGKHMNDTGE